MTPDDPVGVQHGNEFEDKDPAERLSARIILTQDEVQETVKNETRRRLTGVNPAAQEKHLRTREENMTDCSGALARVFRSNSV